MGAAALPIMALATLGTGYLNGRAQQKQANAAAAQAETNARLMERNAEQERAMAQQQDQNNKINEENANRQRQQQLAAQNAKIGASGITATGSALNALSDSAYQAALEGGIQSANNRTTVDNMLNRSNDYDNQANIYHDTASSYRAAGKNAMRTSMIGSVLQIAGMAAQTSLNQSLYSSNSAGTSGAASASSLPGSYADNYGQGALSSTSANYANNYGRGWSSTGFGYSGKTYKVGQGIGW